MSIPRRISKPSTNTSITTSDVGSSALQRGGRCAHGRSRMLIACRLHEEGGTIDPCEAARRANDQEYPLTARVSDRHSPSRAPGRPRTAARQIDRYDIGGRRVWTTPTKVGRHCARHIPPAHVTRPQRQIARTPSDRPPDSPGPHPRNRLRPPSRRGWVIARAQKRCLWPIHWPAGQEIDQVKGAGT